MENTTENYFNEKRLGRLHCVHINLQNCKFFGSTGEPVVFQILTNHIGTLPGCVIHNDCLKV
jgi:hypothetical protein